MVLFRSGPWQEATDLPDEFLAAVKASGEDHCTCQSLGCRFHGRCLECVIIHRGPGDHLPNCVREMDNQRPEGLSALTEHTVTRPAEGK